MNHQNYLPAIRRPRYDGDDAGTTDPQGGNEDAPKLERRVEDAISKQYRPKDVREWLAKHNGNTELALERAIEVMNEATKRTIRRDVEKDEEIANLKRRAINLEAERDAAMTEKAEAQRQIEERQQQERQQALEGRLKDIAPDNHRLLRMALEADGFELEIDNDNVMAKAGDKRHKLSTVLNDDFYGRYPALKPKDEPPFRQAGSDAGKSAAERAAEGFKAFNPERKFSWEQ